MTGTKPFRYSCWGCGAEHLKREILNGCPKCGRPLDVVLDETEASLSKDSLRSRPLSIWRYVELLPVQSEDVITLQEGFTPLIASREVGAESGIPRLMFKNESWNPTGTFKDRSSCVLVSLANAQGFSRVSIDSSGNAASSLACYAARAGLRCMVFVPAGTTERKITQAELYGAEVRVVEGDRMETYRVAKETDSREDTLYCGYLANPIPPQGMKSIAFELCEQTEWDPPEWISIPCGTGTGLIGCWLGLRVLRSMGWISRLPRLLCVQAVPCAPIVRSWLEKKVVYGDPAETVAEGLRIPRPTRLEQAVAFIDESGGRAEVVSDREIMEAARILMQREGLLVEPSSAVSLAGVLKLAGSGEVQSDERVVCLLTGTGLKTTDVYLRHFRR